ncbi:MAG TPA: hypothetical protein DCE33_15915 [Rhodospirillaceae bacterium]|nr:hypothetical protein [Rhodospirillaceae bacterium]
MVSPNQFYGMLRDENLRLVYAEQEKEFIEERLNKNFYYIIFYTVYLISSIILFSAFYLFSYETPHNITFNIFCLSNCFILFILLAPYFEAISDYRKFRGFREEHQRFLARYDRTASSTPPETA